MNPEHPEGLIEGSGQLGEPRLFDPSHDPRHPEHCWCRWIYAGNTKRWCPCCRDADTEDQPEDITP